MCVCVDPGQLLRRSAPGQSFFPFLSDRDTLAGMSGLGRLDSAGLGQSLTSERECVSWSLLVVVAVNVPVFRCRPGVVLRCMSLSPT